AAAINPSQWVSQAFGAYGSPAESNYGKIQLAPPSPWAFPSAPAGAAKPSSLTIGYATNDVALQGLVANYLIANLQKAGIQATARSIPTDEFNSLPKHAATGP